MQDASAYAIKARSPHTAPPARGAEWIHQMLGVASNAQIDAGTDPEAAIEVYVNHGRWIAECPDCKNAQLACKTDPRFLCNECGNVAIGKLWRPVIWPPNVAGVENMLQSRPLVNQNWTPEESGAELGIENLMNMGKIK